MMIYLVQDGFDFKTQLYNLLKTFFQNDQIKIINSNSEELSMTFYILVSIKDLLEENQEEVFSCKIYKNGILGIEKSIKVLKEKSIKTKKHVCKKLVYQVLSTYTGQRNPWGILSGIRPSKIAYKLLDDGLCIKQTYNHLIENYYIAPNKARLLVDIAVKEMEILASNNEHKASLYINIPFCPSRCSYCSFITEDISRYSKQIDHYLKSLIKEIRESMAWINKKYNHINCIYIGGGTPTVLHSNQLKNLLDSIAENIDLNNVQEFTLEAGRPDTLDEDKLKIIKSSTVNRISINPQTMNDETLKLIGRNHSSKKIIETYELARKYGFDNINMDIIAGLPGENDDSFNNTLLEIKKLQPDSLTVHTMSFKKSSNMIKEKKDKEIPSGEVVSKMLDNAKKTAGEINLKPYYLYRQKKILGNLENVGYAKAGYEGIYNVQMIAEKQDIIAFGAGAVSKIKNNDNKIQRVFNLKNIEEYINRIDEMIDKKKNTFMTIE